MSYRPTSQEVSSFLQQLGFSEVAAIGITANLIEETGNFLPSVISGQRRGDNGTAFGMMQWRGIRQTNFFRFAKENNLDPYHWKSQLRFIKAEMTNKNYIDQGSVTAFEKLKKARNVAESTQAFLHAERPSGYDYNDPTKTNSYQKRLAHAVKMGKGSIITARGSGETDKEYNQYMRKMGFTSEGEYLGDYMNRDNMASEEYNLTNYDESDINKSPLFQGEFSGKNMFNFNQQFSDLNPFTNINTRPDYQQLFGV